MRSCGPLITDLADPVLEGWMAEGLASVPGGCVIL
jgi:hypothetical protein